MNTDSIAGNIKLRIITSESEFETLKSRWNDLLRRSSSDNIFLTWEWMFSWWITFKEGKDLLILTAEKDGQLIGIAPFYRTRTIFFGMKPRVYIEFIGSTITSSEYLDIITLQGMELEAVYALLTALFDEKKFQWDVLHITDMREDSPSYKHCLHFFGENNYDCYIYQTKTSPYILLPSTMDDYLKTLSGNMRRKLKVYMKNIRQEIDIKLCRVTDKASLKDKFEEFKALHQLRWDKKIFDGETSGWEGKFLEFHARIQESLIDNGWLYFVYILSDGKMIAAQYSFCYAGKLNCYSSAFDPAMSDKNIGSVMQYLTVEDVIKDKFHELDFLSGSEEYKYYWTKITHPIAYFGVWRTRNDYNKFKIERILRKIARILLPRAVAEKLYRRLFTRN
jgi:CelD/BcsL family acetyltransferase involved in cellulose biosynthesis